MIKQKNFDKKLFNSTGVFMDWELQTEIMWCIIIWFLTCLIFWSHLLIKQMIRSSYLQLCKKGSCSVKLQDGLSEHNPRRIAGAHDFTFNLYKLFYLVNRTEN